MSLPTAETGDWDFDVARRTSSRMAQDITRLMRTVRVFLLFTVLTAAVRQNKSVKSWLAKSLTVALVVGQSVLSIAKIAIWTSPAVKSE